MTAIEFHFKLINLQMDLKRYAISLTSDHEKAKDLVQETFLRALRYREKFTDETNLKAWVFTIMKNVFINSYHQNQLKDSYNHLLKNNYFQNIQNLHDRNNANSVLASQEIEKKVEALKYRYKIPFKMHNNGFKYTEIAETLELKLGTVKSRIFFARKILMEQLSEYID